MEFPHPIQDRQQVYYDAFDKRIRAQLRKLVCDEVIEEHRRAPLGMHSDALERLLNYFRRDGIAGKLGLLQENPAVSAYWIVRFSGARGTPSTVEEGETFYSLDAAYHAVFLRRITDLMTNTPGDVQ
jgi:branched-chain amino acid transport system permease protein